MQPPCERAKSASVGHATVMALHCLSHPLNDRRHRRHRAPSASSAHRLPRRRGVTDGSHLSTWIRCSHVTLRHPDPFRTKVSADMSPDHALSCRAGPSGEPLRRDNAQLGVADEAHVVVCSAENPLSPESDRKKIIPELSWTHSGETPVVGCISGASRQTRVCGGRQRQPDGLVPASTERMSRIP